MVIGARPGGSADRARAAGFEVATLSDAVRGAEVVAALLPDPDFPALYRDALDAALAPGALLVFAHGFAPLYGRISWKKDLDVVLVSPTAPGSVLLDEFRAGRGVPAYLAVVADATGEAWERATRYASALGCDRAGLLRTTLEEEVAVDLFGEQAVLVGGLLEMVSAAVDTLVAAGHSPAMAYLECAHQVKFLTDLLYRRGPLGFVEGVSATALYGGLTRGPLVVGGESRRAMEKALEDVASGRFAAEFLADQEEGAPRLARLTSEATRGPLGRLQAARDQAIGSIDSRR